MKKNLIKIGKRTIGPDSPVFIIAEAGVNHNGDINLARKLIDAAVLVGADAIKFQTFKAEQVATSKGEMADYQKKNTGKAESQLEMLRKLEFKDSWYPRLMEYARRKSIVFLSTPHGSFESIDLLQEMGVPAFKFGSGDLTSLPLLAYAARFGKPMILGTGMATMAEVKDAINAIKKAGNSKIIILHCTTNYPCPYDEVNLRAMQSMMKELPGVLIGYSDHTLGSQVPVMASTLGARVIEKHLTLDNEMQGPDHKASANPQVFEKMINEIRLIDIILGSFTKKASPSEMKLRSIARKSIVAAEDIKIGEVFSRKKLEIKRPGTGMEPKYYNKIIGKKAVRHIKKDEFIDMGDFI